MPQVVGQFFNPPDAGPAVDFSDNMVWTIGDTQTIKFTTTYRDYTIALWQQNLAGGSAILGPVIFQTTAGAVTQFDWSVQLFELDLSFSNVFFLWLHSGDATQQGAAQPQSVSSHYVNFTLSAATTSSSSPSASTTSASPSPSSQVTVLASSMGTTSSSPATLMTSPSSAVPATSGSGLSKGSQAGIGVGASLAGLAALIGCGVAVWYLKKKKMKPVARYELRDNVSAMTKPDNDLGSWVATNQTPSQEPAEIGGNPFVVHRAELDGGYSGRSR